MSSADSTAGPVRVRVVVHGRVQGVWYRGFAREQARAEGLVGWVRNNPDGTVEGVAEGPGAAVDRWLDALRQGPPLADVTDLAVRDEPATGPLEGFGIVR
jgi:acylphosphatase